MNQEDYKAIAKIINKRIKYYTNTIALSHEEEMEHQTEIKIISNELADYFESLSCEHHSAQNCDCNFNREQFKEWCGVRE